MMQNERVGHDFTAWQEAEEINREVKNIKINLNSELKLEENGFLRW